jgi:high affinity Mn2+ porin
MLTKCLKFVLFALLVCPPVASNLCAQQQPAPAPGDQPQQGSDASPSTPPEAPQPMLTFFPHPDSTWWWVSGQTNTIFQAHPGFHSPYQGKNSFRNAGEYKTSLLETLYLGTRLHPGDRYNTDFLFHVESAGGRGLSEAVGIAGFTNLDVVRNPSLGPVPYIARAEIHQTIGFTNEMVSVADQRGPFALATKAPVRRLELRAGKLSTVDMFDINSVGTDSHLQFTNWAIDNTGAYDYAADTRGYTYGGEIEYQDRRWALRYGIFLMPTVANGINLDWSIRRARGEQTEYEWRHSWLKDRDGSTRVLGYWNHAHMGDYREAINACLDDGVQICTPVITQHEHFGALKYGIAANTEQDLTENFRIFSRFGWNEGQHESFTYTEIDQTFVWGGDYRGSRWNRAQDKIGVAFVTNAIKKDHQKYLALGGLGFILGDGRLDYAREDILEAYYNLHAWRGLYFALQQIFVDHPGYNQARGPIYLGGVRVHMDF